MPLDKMKSNETLRQEEQARREQEQESQKRAAETIKRAKEIASPLPPVKKTGVM